MGYTRQEFIDEKTVLTAEHLKNMENGIIEAINLASTSSNGSSSDTVIPDYWKTYMDTKIAEINALNEELGSAADTFIFLADTHFPNNSGNSINLIRYILENTSIRKVFIGGDIIEGNQGNSTDIALLRELQKKFKGIQIFPVRGNHDAHTSDITDNQWWDIVTRNLTAYCNVSDKMYYYYDNNAQKIRYIFADSIWGYGKYAADSYLTSKEQLQWIQSKILELDEDWTALIIKHHVWDFNCLGTLNKEGELIVGAINEIYYEAKCKIAGVYAGHAHYDHTLTTDFGYVVVTTIGDNNQVSGWRNGTTSEQAFDVVSLNPNTGVIKTIRIGNDRGSNREITYALINEIINVENINLDSSQLILRNGATKTLTASFTPSYVSNKNIMWSITSGNDYIQIAPNGLACDITGLSIGTAKVTATSEDGGFTAECTISIVESQAVDITDQFNFTEGAMISANNGNYSTYNGWVANENYVDVSNYSEIEIKMSKTSSTTTGTGLALYDANKNYVSGIPHTDGVATYGTMIKTIEIPSNVKYVRTTYWSTSNSNYKTEFGEFYCKGIV